MPPRYFRSGATLNWNTAANWSATPFPSYSAGAIPTASDDVFFELQSANCIFNVAGVTLSINFSSYTNTFAFGNFNLSVTGNIILGSGTTFTRGTGTIIATGNPSLTSNGKIFNIPLVFQTAGRTLTFIDDWTLSSSLTITGTLASPISARTQTLGVQRKLTLLQGTGSADIDYCIARDLDSGDGITIWNYKGTQTNCVNWLNLPTGPIVVSSII
jgi:hypothetical protein